MKRNFTRIVLPLCGAAALIGAMMATSAHAEPTMEPQSLSDCKSGNVCLWVDAGFPGIPRQYGSPVFRNVDAADHDRVSSWANKTSYTYCLYDNGSSITLDRLGPGATRPNMPGGTNDRADAIGRC
ncbi:MULTISPECIES: peptidase inhibitor family I36 protein [unclassified Nonomuraea]|uniref:peptidase inhibitor family I36 protein n=1 Tax=Nonomuraea sp. NPDC047529 TaxID=3155623 RepID=UPI0033FB2D1E